MRNTKEGQRIHRTQKENIQRTREKAEEIKIQKLRTRNKCSRLVHTSNLSNCSIKASDSVDGFIDDRETAWKRALSTPW